MLEALGDSEPLLSTQAMVGIVAQSLAAVRAQELVRCPAASQAWFTTWPQRTRSSFLYPQKQKRTTKRHKRLKNTENENSGPYFVFFVPFCGLFSFPWSPRT